MSTSMVNTPSTHHRKHVIKAHAYKHARTSSTQPRQAHQAHDLADSTSNITFPTDLLSVITYQDICILWNENIRNIMQKGQNIHFTPGWTFSVYSTRWKVQKNTHLGVNFTSPPCNMLLRTFWNSNLLKVNSEQAIDKCAQHIQ